MVTSTIGIPPLATASIAKWASSVEDTRIAGMMPISRIRAHTSSLVIGQFLLRKFSYWFFCFRLRKPIANAGEPRVKSRQEKDAHDQVGNKSDANYYRERPL